MQIIVTHTNTDFDALASMVAATFLYRGATGVLPSQVRANVKRFLALHRGLFRLCAAREVDSQEVIRLVAVDTNNWGRLENMSALRERGELDVHLWDHHMEGTTFVPSWRCQEERGAAITLLLREMKKRDCAFSPMHATLFLLGLYEDTGNLSYPSTTAEDASMAGFLLENGADLNVAGAYLASSFDESHTEILTRMLDEGRTFDVAGYRTGMAFLSLETSHGMLSSVVTKYQEIKGLDVTFGLFGTDSGKCMVIGRAGLNTVDVGALMRRLGGGGHSCAGSAMVRTEAPETLLEQLADLVSEEMTEGRVRVRDIMSHPGQTLAPETTMEEACVLVRTAPSRAVPVVRDGRWCGLLTVSECDKAKSESQRRGPVRALMKTQLPLLQPDQGAQEALKLSAQENLSLLPVVQDGWLVGVVTEADLMLHLYDF